MKNELQHVMIDIETMSRRIGSALILSIGAVQFSLDGTIGATFHTNVTPEGQEVYGLRMEGDTFYWWLQQNEKARENLLNPPPKPLEVALDDFSQWFEYIPTDNPRVWGNGRDFDISILTVAYDRMRRGTPWSYRNVRDVRTIYALASHIKPIYKHEAHTVIGDCRNQIDHIVRIVKLKKIRKID